MEADEHRAEVEAWRAARYAALRRDVGWLTLAGLAWLRPGVNRVGSAPGSDARLPSGPSSAGTIEVTGTHATASGAWRHGGRAVDRLPLVTDAAGEPTMLELGDLRSCVIERGGRLALRTWDLGSVQRRGFDGIPHWPVDLAWRLPARFEATPGRRVAVPDVIGMVEEEPSPGDVVLELGGAEHRLQALEGGPSGELWLVFGDATNGVESYAGGRFLYTDPPADAGRLVVDFNRAYNPPCVFSDHATCPLPWPPNRLPLRITAGERMYRRP